MRMNSKLRAALLTGALALTLVAVRWADKLTDVTEASAGAVAEATPRARVTPGAATTGQPPPPLDLSKLRRAPVVDPNGDPFGARSFRPDPPKAKTGPALAAAGSLRPGPHPEHPAAVGGLPASKPGLCAGTHDLASV